MVPFLVHLQLLYVEAMGRENLEKKNGIRYEGDIKINLDSTLCSNALYVCMCVCVMCM